MAPWLLIVPAKQVSPGPLGDGDRLPRDRRLVDGRLAGQHTTVDRDPLAGPHQHDLAQPQLFDGDHPLLAVAQNGRHFRRELHQRPHRPLGPSQGVVLQRVRGGEESEQDRAFFPIADDGGADGRGDHQEVDTDRSLQEEIAQRGDGGEGAASDIGENEERGRDPPRRGGRGARRPAPPPGRASRRARPRPGSSAPRSFPPRRRGEAVRLGRVAPRRDPVPGSESQSTFQRCRSLHCRGRVWIETRSVRRRTRVSDDSRPASRHDSLASPH